MACAVVRACRMGVVIATAMASPLIADEPLLAFTEEAVERGVSYLIVPHSGFQPNGFGIAITDLNGDGHQDIFLTGNPGGTVGVFENDGTGYFTDRSFMTNANNQTVPVLAVSRPSGVAIADYDGDGLVDMYVTQEMYQNTGQLYPNFLLRNQGDFAFTDVTLTAGVGNFGHSQAAAWGDYDNDGWLDLYLANYAFPQYAGNPAHWNKLFRNKGDGSFEEVAVALGVASQNGMSFTPVFTDINRDGWLDLYLANDRGHYPSLLPNQLWRNEGGEFISLCDEPSDSGACVGLWAMCAAAGDVSGNGYTDFYVSNIAHPGGYNGWNAFLVNQGDESFVEQCPDAQVCSLATAWGGVIFDYDNNGWQDIYVCNQAVPNRLYANSGEFPLTNVAADAAVVGSTGWSYNVAVGDVTGNGAIDILLNNYGPAGGAPANVQLFINHEGTTRNWLRFDVAGLPGSGNIHAIGANIEVTAQGHTLWREIFAGGNSYKSQNELVFHFGMNESTVAEEIIVNWPGGEVQRVLSNYPANHRWTMYPPAVLGDANGDGAIGVADLLAMLEGWGLIMPGYEISDMNGDGAINVADLLALLAKWGSN